MAKPMASSANKDTVAAKSPPNIQASTFSAKSKAETELDVFLRLLVALGSDDAVSDGFLGGMTTFSVTEL